MLEFLEKLRSIGAATDAVSGALFEMSSDWFWIMDAELRYVYFSGQVETVTGDPPEWHYGKTRFDLGITIMDGSDPLERREPFRDSLISRANRQGRVIWIKSSGRPVHDADGRFLGYIGTGTDVTAAIEAQRAAESRHDLFVQAMESMTDGFALFDASDRLVFCNDRFKALNPELAQDLTVGMTFEDMIRLNLARGRLLDAVGREDAFLEDRMRVHRAQSGQPIVSRRSDGLILEVREVHLDDGSTFVINSDQTVLRRRTTELERAKNEAEAANRAKSDFLANMSHELRTPLNAILGFSEIIQSQALDSGRYADYAAAIHNSGQHLLSLINDILDLNAVESGRFELSPEAMSPRALVAGILQTMRPIAKRAGIRLRGTAPRLPTDLWLDRRSIEQCLLNLMSNAIKFSPPGAPVSLTVAGDHDGGTRITVADEGSGMDARTIQSIGRPFAHAAHGVAQRGTGLGLAITKSIVEAMHGELVFQSAPGRGTRATIVLPPPSAGTP